jgi:hypothetical protein
MEKHYLTGLTIRHVIMSRGRSDRVPTHKLVPRATLVVPENEVEAYRPLGLEIVPILPDRIGVSAVRNWIVRRFEEEAVVMYGDWHVG